MPLYLDNSLAFLSYCRRLKFSKKTQDLITTIRSSPPHRNPQARHGNMPVSYPSIKMQCMIKAESRKVEFAFVLEAEHEDDVLEFYDQPHPPLELSYETNGRKQISSHTADYFVLRSSSAGWEECKPVNELVRLSQRSNRYHLDEQGVWRCSSGEKYAAEYGLTYSVRSSDQINWIAQDNWLYLDEYYQDLKDLEIPKVALTLLYEIVDEYPGISLAALREMSAIPSDLINIAIAQHILYVDLLSHRLTEAHKVPVYRDEKGMKAHIHRDPEDLEAEADTHPVVIEADSQLLWDGNDWSIANVGKTEITLSSQNNPSFSLPRSAFENLVKEGKIIGVRTSRQSSFTEEGNERLLQADDRHIATATFRNRVIHPEDYDDEAQKRLATKIATVSERSKYRWKQQYAEGERIFRSGFIGLIPQYCNCGGGHKTEAEIVEIIENVLKEQYDTVTCRLKRGAYGAFLVQCDDKHLKAVCQTTFYTYAKYHLPLYEQTLLREGSRGAYPYKDYDRSNQKTTNPNGEYAWAMGYIDHTQPDLELYDSKTGKCLGKCWLTLLILAYPRRVAAYYLTFDPPSYRSCMMVLRLCVKRYGRLPSAITVDGGREFSSVYFEKLLALYRVRKHQRPASEPRFGSPQERLFGTMNTEFIYHLVGNTQATKEPRKMTRATDPRRLGVWTLETFAERVIQWADEEYDVITHPALHLTPKEAYEQSIQRDGERKHKLIPYDKDFIRSTYPTTTKGTAKVQPGTGVRMNYLDYWCEEMNDSRVVNTQVRVRYDPFDVSVGYAYFLGEWRKCRCPEQAFVGCSERELQLLAEELHEKNRLLYGRAQIELTQKKLAIFRQEVAEQEKVLQQQQHDRETKQAFIVLEEGKWRKQEPQPSLTPSISASSSHPSTKRDSDQQQVQKSVLNGKTGTTGDKLIILKRYR